MSKKYEVRQLPGGKKWKAVDQSGRTMSTPKTKADAEAEAKKKGG